MNFWLRPWSSSNKMSPGPRPTSIASGILIYPTVWPQYTNVTERTDRQRFGSIGRTVLQTVAPKLVIDVRSGLDMSRGRQYDSRRRSLIATSGIITSRVVCRGITFKPMIGIILSGKDSAINIGPHPALRHRRRDIYGCCNRRRMPGRSERAFCSKSARTRQPVCGVSVLKR